MRGSSIATFGLLGALVLTSCAGFGAEAGGDASPSATATDSSTASARSVHGHSHDHSDVPAQIALEPTCVEPGGTVTVTVDTVPRSGVLYLAYYSDDKSGAKEPMGAGYGGNGGGYAADDGTFEESWTISEETPGGPARLRVITMADDGEEIVDFTVAGTETGSC